jgi:hypothetical protein
MRLLLHLVFLGFLAGISAVEDGTPKKIPTAYVSSGGGFTAMTTSMGFARALSKGNVLPLLTHAGSNSGGTWFLTQLAFSKPFYESVTGMSGGTISEAVAEWGSSYGAAMRAAVESDALKNITFQAGEASKLCPYEINGTSILDLITDVVSQVEYVAMFPASNWYEYVADMLDSYIPNVRTQTFSAPREGLPSTTLSRSLSLVPDIYDNTGKKQARLEGVAAGGFDVLPISFSAKAGENGVWSLPSFAPSLNVAQGSSFNKEVVPLGLSPNASIAEINAGSSSAGGAFGSPTMVRRSLSPAIASPLENIFLMQTMCLSLNILQVGNIVSAVLDMAPQTQNLSRIRKAALKTGILGCMPLGLQNSSAPLGGDASSWLPTYRYLDGAFTDNTGLTHTIARMQADCSAPDSMYDCSEGVRATVMNSGSRDESLAVQGLFANYTGNTPYPNQAGPGYAIQIFEEGWPDDDDLGWTMYSNHTYYFKNGERAPEDGSGPIVSWVWQGYVTTVDNAAFGVAAGTQVRLSLFMAATPTADFIIWPGYAAEFAFSRIYSQVAQVQADSVQKIIEMWPEFNTISSADSPTLLGSESPTDSPTSSCGPNNGFKGHLFALFFACIGALLFAL